MKTDDSDISSQLFAPSALRQGLRAEGAELESIIDRKKGSGHVCIYVCMFVCLRISRD